MTCSTSPASRAASSRSARQVVRLESVVDDGRRSRPPAARRAAAAFAHRPAAACAVARSRSAAPRAGDLEPADECSEVFGPGGGNHAQRKRRTARSHRTERSRRRASASRPRRCPKIFQMFAQVEGTAGRSEGGLGIGLSLVKELVETAWRHDHGAERWTRARQRVHRHPALRVRRRRSPARRAARAPCRGRSPAHPRGRRQPRCSRQPGDAAGPRGVRSHARLTRGGRRSQRRLRSGQRPASSTSACPT